MSKPVTNEEHRRRHLLFYNLWRRDPDIFLVLTASQLCSAHVYYSPVESYGELQLIHLRQYIERTSPGVVRQANNAYRQMDWIIKYAGELYGVKALNDGTAIRRWVADHPRHSSAGRSISMLAPVLELAAQLYVEEVIFDKYDSTQFD